MKVIRLSLNVAGRFLLSLVFLVGAVNKIFHWRESESFLLNTLCEWQAQIGFSDLLSDFFSSLIGWTPLLLLAAFLFELLGALSVLLGFKEKWGAFLLILFLIPSTLIMHAFWFCEGSAREAQLIHFLKNLALLGGLLLFCLQESREEPRHSISKNIYG